MKPRNFPARKLQRKIIANGGYPEFNTNILEQARAIRTKKDRSSKQRGR